MFAIDSQSRCPVYEQLVAQFEKFILTGILSPGDQIPSVRSLSMDLSVNPNTIQRHTRNWTIAASSIPPQGAAVLFPQLRRNGWRNTSWGSGKGAESSLRYAIGRY
ncbi:MAG: GntR family transcriptional regulator [Clostridia bacterium]